MIARSSDQLAVIRAVINLRQQPEPFLEAEHLGAFQGRAILPTATKASLSGSFRRKPARSTCGGAFPHTKHPSAVLARVQERNRPAQGCAWRLLKTPWDFGSPFVGDKAGVPVDPALCDKDDMSQVG